jgi:hypothetical protein
MRTTGIVAFLFLTVLTKTAFADEQPASPEVLFKDGNALAAAGKYAEACPKLAESQRLEPAVGTQFNLADCYEHLGKTATAFALFNDVAHIARAAGKFERERSAKDRASALVSRLARLRLNVTAPAPGEEIRIDGAVVPRDKWSAGEPIDPGAHQIVASAPSRTSWTGSVDSAEGKIGELTVPELIDPSPKPGTPLDGGGKPASSTQRTIAIALGGVGVAGLAVGAIAGAMAISSRSKAEEACPEATYHFRCPTNESTDDWNAATSAGNVSTVGFILGGVALAAAGVLWFTAPSSKKSNSTAWMIAPGVVRGTF